MIKKWEVVYRGPRHTSVVHRCWTRWGARWLCVGLSDRFQVRRAS